MRWFEEQVSAYHFLGGARYWSLWIALFAYIGLFVALLDWLSEETGWPEAYGSRCHGRGCWPTYLWHSFNLLKGASGYEVGLFALLWHVPVLVGAIVGVVVTKWKLKRRRDRIRPMRD